MRVAVVGGGVSGLVAAYVAAEAGVEVVLYEKEDYLGGHAKTVTADGTSLDLGFMVFNRITQLFLEGHSNRLVRIIGLNFTPIMDHLDFLEPEEMFLRYSPLPVYKED